MPAICENNSPVDPKGKEALTIYFVQEKKYLLRTAEKPTLYSKKSTLYSARKQRKCFIPLFHEALKIIVHSYKTIKERSRNFEGREIDIQ